ncbi:MAG: hypothetical protein JWO68_3584, partial [Actinomycetia bacterium]|nr:hypothetical protein [Actinomycetes bacterium]
MLKGRLRRLVALGVLVGAVAAVVEAAPMSSASTYPAAASPYDSQTVFCTPSAAPAGV